MKTSFYIEKMRGVNFTIRKSVPVNSYIFFFFFCHSFLTSFFPPTYHHPLLSSFLFFSFSFFTLFPILLLALLHWSDHIWPRAAAVLPPFTFFPGMCDITTSFVGMVNLLQMVDGTMVERRVF